MHRRKPLTLPEIIFTLLVAAFFFALGGYLNTFSAEIVRAISLVVLVGTAIGLALWFWWRYWGPSVGMFLMVSGTVLIAVGGVIGLVGAMRADFDLANKPNLTDTPSLLSLFMGLLQPKQGATIHGFTEIEALRTRVYYNLYLDFNSKTKYIAFYVSHQQDILKTLKEIDCKEVADSVGNTVRINPHVIGGTATTVNTKDYLFSGMTYIFHEDEIGLENLSDAAKQLRERGCTAEFYSEAFKLSEWNAIRTGVVPKMRGYEIRNGLIQAAL